MINLVLNVQNKKSELRHGGAGISRTELQEIFKHGSVNIRLPSFDSKYYNAKTNRETAIEIIKKANPPKNFKIFFLRLQLTELGEWENI